ncbi:MAG: ankyrin repeat domain-containing protein [Polyangiaceae bacterium]
MTSAQDAAVLWNLGRRLSSVFRGADKSRFSPKPDALAAFGRTLDKLGVRIALAELSKLEPQARAKEIAKIRDGAGPIVSLGWSAQLLSEYASLEPNERGPMAEAARGEALRFTRESAELDPKTKRAVAELRGWCEAIAGGWAEDPYNLSELALLVDELYPGGEQADSDADTPVTFRTATVDHVVMMIVMHHIVSTISALRCGPSSMFHGGVKDGRHAFNDQSESHFIVGWNEYGVVGFAFHKYACEEELELEPAERKPMRWVPDVPPALLPLATELSNQAGRFFTAGMWISRDGKRNQDGAGGEDGSNHFQALSSAPREALFKRPGHWAALRSITTDQAELARSLAKRAVAGGGELSREESEVLVERSPEHGEGALFSLTDKSVHNAIKELAKVGLVWRGAEDAIERENVAVRAAIERAIAAAMSPDERALFDAARANDVAAVKELVGRGVSMERGAVQDQFGELPIMPGMTPLYVAIRARAVEAALALIEVGADVSKEVHMLSPLICAAQARSVEIARALLARGASTAGTRHRSPLDTAVGNDDLPMVELLLAAKDGLGAPGYAERLLSHLREEGKDAMAALFERAIRERGGAQ